MAIQVPENRKEVSDRIKTDVQNNLPQSNPFLSNSWFAALIQGFAGRIYDIYYQIKNILFPNLFINTATLTETIERWADIYGIVRNPATQAEGNITATGTASTVIPDNTEFQSSAGIVLKTQGSATITAQSISVSSLTRVGTTVTATTASNHALTTGVSVTISGAVETDYNGTFEIVVTALNKFTYEITGTPTSPATGTILAGFTIADLSVKTDDFGQSANLSAGDTVTVTTPIAGMDSEAVVQFGEVAGGTDIETDASLQQRVLFKIQNPTSHFNSASIELKAKEISGVTRVWIFEATPSAGKVEIYFTRDNDDNIIPSGAEITETKNKILEIKPAHTPDSYVIVNAPTAVNIDFTFSSLSPNTTSMQSSINTSLQQFFREEVNVGENITEDKYRAAIQNTIDNETGEKVISFTLSTPTTDISISSGELGVLGTVTF
jgi:uncharacterized phage protein gp47/JayE